MIRTMLAAVGVLVCASVLGADPKSVEIKHGDALVGVDALGRVLVAFDDKAKGSTDGLVDIWYLFTATERLDGPWSKFLQDAKVTTSEGLLTVAGSHHSFILQVHVESKPLKEIKGEKYAEVYKSLNGLELVTLPDESSDTTMSSVDFTDIYTQPEPLWYDTLNAKYSATICTPSTFAECSAEGTSGGLGSPGCGPGFPLPCK